MDQIGSYSLVTEAEMTDFVTGLFDESEAMSGPIGQSLDMRMPILEAVKAKSSEPIELASDKEVRDFIVGLFKSKQS